MLHTAWVCSIFQKEGTEMQEQVKATFLVNAAVLLEFRGTKLLIDGIYDENGHLVHIGKQYLVCARYRFYLSDFKK